MQVFLDYEMRIMCVEEEGVIGLRNLVFKAVGV